VLLRKTSIPPQEKAALLLHEERPPLLLLLPPHSRKSKDNGPNHISTTDSIKRDTNHFKALDRLERGW
jgi:hypothetical protein